MMKCPMSVSYTHLDVYKRQDHVSGIDDMCAAIETVPVIYMSKLEMMYEDFPFKKQWGHSCHKRYWEEYSMVVIDSMQFKVIPTPGHLPGSVCIITNKYLISGDLLTNDSIGRTDFIGGNVNDMFFSLEKVLKLSDSLIVLPGHGAVTTMEKTKNCNCLLYTSDMRTNIMTNHNRLNAYAVENRPLSIS